MVSEYKERERKKELRIIRETKDKFLKQDTMKGSIKEGAFASIMSGAGDGYITPFALAIGANNFQVGLIRSLAGLLAPLGQLKGSRLMEKYSRKKILVTFVALQALIWFPIIFLGVLFLQEFLLAYLPYALILLYLLYAIFGALSYPAWFSLMGDVVPNNSRGKYFSKRTRITSFIVLVSLLISAFVLDFFKTRGFALLGFSIIFSIAGFSRLYSATLFAKHYEPKLKLKKGYYFSFFDFLKKGLKTNFGKFVMFLTTFYLVTYIAGPFFAVYMLRDLNFSYLSFMIVNISGTLAALLFLPFWGKISDKHGNKIVLLVCSALASIFPFLWLLFKTPYLLIIPQFFGGIAWAGFNLSASNFIYDSVSVKKRGLCVAYYHILLGIGIFVGAGLGGLITQYIPIKFMNVFLFVFLLSGMLRALTVLIFTKKIKEIRKVKDTTPQLVIKDLVRMEGIKHDIGIMKNYFFKEKSR